MNALKIQQFLFVVVSTFIATAGPVFLANAANIFDIDASTWQIIISAGVAGVINYFIMFFAPQNKNFGLGSKV